MVSRSAIFWDVDTQVDFMLPGGKLYVPGAEKLIPNLKRLTDARELLALLKRHGVELVLHGHDHVHSTIWVEGPNGAIPAVGVPSASAVAHGRYPDAAYNLFSIARDGAAWRCEQTVRSIDDKLHVDELRRTRLI